MKIEKFDGKMESWWNKPLTKLKKKDGNMNEVATIEFNGTFEAFGPDKDVKLYTDADWEAALTELREKNEYPTAQEIVQLRNDKRKAKARQAAMVAEVVKAELVQPTTENDEQLRLKKMADLYVANGLSEADAKVKASEALGIAWD